MSKVYDPPNPGVLRQQIQTARPGSRYRAGLARRFDVLTAEAIVIAQRRMVAEANAKLQAEKDRGEAEKQNRQRGAFSAPASRQPPPTTRKRAEDDEP